MSGAIIMGPVDTQLSPYVGKWVTVAICKRLGQRSNFQTQISVHGELEAHEGTYRVLVTDSTYTYFTTTDVAMVTENADTGTIVFHLAFSPNPRYFLSDLSKLDLTEVR